MKKASVYLITYNHEKFIARAIESIVTQKVNFDFEVVIGEDCSKDTTRAICEEYAKKYPLLINLLPSDKNYGPMENAIRILNACTGKYIALCEGDDYWTDTNKLQKQVDFLDANADFSMCFSAVDIVDEMANDWPDDRFFPKLDKDIFSMEDFILSGMNIIPTPTLVFRRTDLLPLPHFFRTALAGDLMMQQLLADKGRAKYFPEKMAVYRNHSGGLSKSEESLRRGNEDLLKVFAQMNAYFNFRYNAIFRKRFLNNARMELIFGARDKKGIEKLTHYFKKMPGYLKYSDPIDWKELAYYHMVLFTPFLLKSLKKK